MRTRRNDLLNEAAAIPPSAPGGAVIAGAPVLTSGDSGVPVPKSRKKSKRTFSIAVSGFNRLLVYLFPPKHDDALSVRPPPPSLPPSDSQTLAAATTATTVSVATASRPSTALNPRDMLPHSQPATVHDSPLDIVLHSDAVVLRGTGSDYEPATLRGVVKLSLAEATDIKEVTIRLIGKAKIAVMQKEGTRLQSQTLILYLQEHELLQGDKSHPHTLKSGRHEFPFTFSLDARSAASLSANFGASVIEWRLRALAVRPSLSTNWVASRDVEVVRSFANEALEFQQTLEIENTWPEKIQYSVILPHKAWAAGDHLSAVLKFTPLAKGVKVVSVKMSLQEKVKTVWRNTPHEEVRIVCSRKEALKRGRPIPRQPTPPPSVAGEGNEEGLQTRRRGQQHGLSIFRRVGSRVQSRENLLGLFRGSNSRGDEPPLPTAIGTGTGASSPTGPLASASASRSVSPPASPTRSRSSTPSVEGDADVEMVMRMRIPSDTTPSHGVAPVFISHRVKWDVLISNFDGHYSELRCSLPVHLLSKEVLQETIEATNATRTALLGEGHGISVQEVILPAYSDHLRDRVPIDELQDQSLATNPLITPQPHQTPSSEGEGLMPGLLSSSYGPSSTLNEQFRNSNVPRIASMPDTSDRGRRGGMYLRSEEQSSELYLSLGRQRAAMHPDAPGSQPASQPSSRASSPERMERRGPFGGIRPLTSVFKSKGSTPSNSTPPPSGSGRKRAHKFSLSRTSSNPSSTPSSPDPMQHYPLPLSRSSNSPTSTQMSSLPSSSVQSSMTSSAGTATTGPSLADYYDAVPEYAFAAQGFLGGGITPLSALRGLPSYDQAQRSRGVSPVTSGTSGTSSTSGGSRRRRSVTGRRLSEEERRSNERRIEEERQSNEVPVQQGQAL